MTGTGLLKELKKSDMDTWGICTLPQKRGIRTLFLKLIKDLGELPKAKYMARYCAGLGLRYGWGDVEVVIDAEAGDHIYMEAWRPGKSSRISVSIGPRGKITVDDWDVLGLVMDYEDAS